MNTKINNRIGFLIALTLFFFTAFPQKVSVYKIDDLLKRIHNTSDTTYIVNFWATWCKPCVAELPDFNKIDSVYKTQKIKVILVSLDFKEDVKLKLKPFIAKHKFKAEIIVLDEVNGNDFINKVSESWSGAIPATLITKNNNQISEFYEKKLSYEFIVERLQINKSILNQ